MQRKTSCSINQRAYSNIVTFITAAYGYSADPGTFRSSRLEVFCKKEVLRNFAKLAAKYLCQSLFLNKVAGLGNF